MLRTAATIAIAVAVALLLSGCVTTTSGGLPAPLPDNERVQAQLDLARGYLANRNWSGARQPLQRALEIDPRSADAHMLFGVLFQGEGEPVLAERSMKRALQVDADNPLALNNYGTFLYEQGRFTEAEKMLARVASNPSYGNRSQAFENLGLVRQRLEDSIGATEAFERAVELNTGQAVAHLELADLRLAAGELRAAQTHFQLWRRQARPTARSLCIGMRIAAAERDSDSVASYAMALANLYPDSEEAQTCQVAAQ